MGARETCGWSRAAVALWRSRSAGSRSSVGLVQVAGSLGRRPAGRADQRSAERARRPSAPSHNSEATLRDASEHLTSTWEFLAAGRTALRACCPLPDRRSCIGDRTVTNLGNGSDTTACGRDLV
jgi:hypothetical protein